AEQDELFPRRVTASGDLEQMLPRFPTAASRAEQKRQALMRKRVPRIVLENVSVLLLGVGEPPHLAQQLSLGEGPQHGVWRAVAGNGGVMPQCVGTAPRACRGLTRDKLRAAPDLVSGNDGRDQIGGQIELPAVDGNAGPQQQALGAGTRLRAAPPDDEQR